MTLENALAKASAVKLPETRTAFYLARRHARYDPKLEEAVSQQPSDLVRAKTTLEARKLCDMHNQVARSLCSSKAFVRFETSEHGILHGRVSPEHHTEDLMAAFHARRFPKFTVVIGSPRGTFVASKKLGNWHTSEKLEQVVKSLEKKLPKLAIMKDLNSFDNSIWSAFYKSQYIQGRKNIKQFNRFVPKKIRNAEINRDLANADGIKTLDKF